MGRVPRIVPQHETTAQRCSSERFFRSCRSMRRKSGTERPGSLHEAVTVVTMQVRQSVRVVRAIQARYMLTLWSINACAGLEEKQRPVTPKPDWGIVKR